MKTPIDKPLDAQPSPIGFNEIRYAIPTGSTTLGVSARSPRCPLIMRKVNQGISSRSFVNDDYSRLFRDAMTGLGYDVAGDPGRMFDEQEDRQRAVYALGARVIDIKMDVCTEQSLLFDYDLGVIGEAMIEIEWTIYDVMRRRNVYKTRTKGYADMKAPNDEGIALLLENAFSAATHNLGADPEFFALVFNGSEPANSPRTVLDPDDDPAALFNSQEEVNIAPLPLSQMNVAGKMDAAEKVAVLIQTAGTHGSGFFITKDGHILTNAHVVGHARRARIVTSGKKNALFAEVLRVDRARDIALLRLTEKLEDLNIELLPIRLDKPAISEEIYAIGAPLQSKLQGTVTKGIVSAHRRDSREKLDYIQGDVYIYGGNSGGPLLDANGNIVGLSVAGYNDGEQALSGLNLFIPISDALKALNIDAGTQEKGAPLPLVSDFKDK